MQGREVRVSHARQGGCGLVMQSRGVLVSHAGSDKSGGHVPKKVLLNPKFPKIGGQSTRCGHAAGERERRKGRREGEGGAWGERCKCTSGTLS